MNKVIVSKCYNSIKIIEYITPYILLPKFIKKCDKGHVLSLPSVITSLNRKFSLKLKGFQGIKICTKNYTSYILEYYL